jgi:hypothetical protein
MSAKASPTTTIEVPNFARGRATLTLAGDSPLICHAWSDKAKKMMLDKQMKKAKGGKEAKDPERDFQESLYPHPDGGYGFPVVGFKAAAVSACRYVDGLPMTVARGAFHINGEMAQVEGSEPTMREDMVRVGMGTADIRYRGQFDPWGVRLDLVYNPAALSLEQIVNLFNIAGFGVGVGEWRPEKDGQYGRFHVQDVTEAKR